MWPFSEMSLASATFWFDVANLVLLASLIFGVLSTFAIVRFGNVKERRWDELRQQSDEKIVAANERIAALVVQLAEAQKETAQAKLALEQLQAKAATRRVEYENVKSALAGKPKLKYRVVYVGTDPDASRLAGEISRFLGGGAEWDMIEFPQPLPNVDGVSGIKIVLHTLLPDSLWTHPFASLTEAFKPLRCIISGNPTVPEGSVLIVVGPKEP